MNYSKTLAVDIDYLNEINENHFLMLFKTNHRKNFSLHFNLE